MNYDFTAGCYVVVVLKMRNSEYQFAGKINKPHAFCQLAFTTHLTSLFLKDLTGFARCEGFEHTSRILRVANNCWSGGHDRPNHRRHSLILDYFQNNLYVLCLLAPPWKSPRPMSSFSHKLIQIREVFVFIVIAKIPFTVGIFRWNRVQNPGKNINERIFFESFWFSYCVMWPDYLILLLASTSHIFTLIFNIRNKATGVYKPSKYTTIPP